MTEIQFDKSREHIGLRSAHLFGQGDPRVRVAILDTGIDAIHPALSHAIESQADFGNLDGLDTTNFIGVTSGYDRAATDEVGNGTHVAGIIAARGDQIYKGVAPACRIIAVCTLATMKDGGTQVGAGIVDNINNEKMLSNIKESKKISKFFLEQRELYLLDYYLNHLCKELWGGIK